MGATLSGNVCVWTGKPDPFPLELAITQMNEAAHLVHVRPNEAIYIGDTGDDMRVRNLTHGTRARTDIHPCAQLPHATHVLAPDR